MSNSDFEQKWLETNNGKICYFPNIKFADKPTIVFLHGLSSNHTTWSASMLALEKLGLNMLAPDLRGHGHSDKTKKRNLYKFSIFAHDLEAILAQEKLGKIILVGYSYGGFVALEYAVKNQEKISALILISANHTNALKYKHLLFLTWPIYGLLTFLAFLLLWQQRKKYYYYDQARSRGYWQSTFAGFTTMPLSINLWMLSEGAYLDFSRNLDKINFPTLIIKSQRDPFLSSREARDMQQKIKNSEIITLYEKSHFLASRYQQKIIDVILKFLKDKAII